MDFETIQGHVEGYVLDLPATTLALVPTFVNKAINDAGKRIHNFQHMEASTSFTTAEGTQLLGSRPALWKRRRGFPYFLRDDGTTSELEWMTSESESVRQFDDESAPAASDDTPQFIREIGADGSAGTFDLYPVPDGLSDYTDGDYRIVVPYWTLLADLVNNTDTNWWTDNYPWYVIWQAAAEGMQANRDFEVAGVYVAKAEKEYQDARTADIRKRLPDRMSLHNSRNVFGKSKAARRLR